MMKPLAQVVGLFVLYALIVFASFYVMRGHHGLDYPIIWAAFIVLPLNGYRIGRLRPIWLSLLTCVVMTGANVALGVAAYDLFPRLDPGFRDFEGFMVTEFIIAMAANALAVIAFIVSALLHDFKREKQPSGT